MKRIMSLLLVLLALLSLTIPCSAADEELAITNAAIKQGDTIYLRVTLNKDLKGDSIGISFDFDDSLLKSLPKLSTWEKKGALQDFNVNHAGVWAASSAVNLKGDLCVLAFKLLDGAKLTETEVTCTVTIKNGAKTLGEYTAEAIVSMHCDHEYDTIKDNGQIGHSKTCKLCSKAIAQSHNWTEDKVIPNPNSPNTNLQVYVCSECKAEKQVPVAIEKEDHSHTHPTEAPTQSTEPTAPQLTLPPQETRPQEPLHTSTEPTHPNHDQDSDSNPNRNPSENNDKNNQSQGSNGSSQGTQNSNPSKPSTNDKNNSNPNDQTNPTIYIDYNSASIDSDDPHAGHDHANDESGNKAPMIVDGNGIIETVPTEHDHDHDDTDVDHANPIGAAVAFVVLGILMVGLPIYLIKAKKRI